MQKNILMIVLICALLCSVLPGCGEKSSTHQTSSGVDVDLTTMSSTMIFSEVFNMMNHPEDYIGKTIKISGQYYAANYEEKYYHFIVISDATACCQQGLEFVLSGDKVYPDDYPANYSNVSVTGVFSSYEESGNTNYYLEANDIHAFAG